MSTIHPDDQAPLKGEPTHATTTEELIVQYLDGELVRKELETMLFERLAESAQARALLREYLTVRGAIRSSLEDNRFQLSSELDARTRARIEQMLEQGTLEKAPLMASRLAADAPPVQTNPVKRSMNRWALRPSLALLALLLAIGTTWFVTRSTSSPQLADNQSANNQPQTPSDVQPAASGLPSAPIAQVPTVSNKPVVHEVIHYVRVPVLQKVAPTNSMAQNTSAAASMQPQKQSEPADPADIMISHRYAKILNAEEKHEIVVSSRDRL